MLGSAFFAERRTLVWLLYTSQYQTADAQRGLLRINFLYFEKTLGIVVPEVVLKLIATLRDRSDTAPFAVAYFKYLMDQMLSGNVSIAGNHTTVLILNFGPMALQLANRFQDAFQQVCGLESGNYNRHLITRGDRLIFSVAHNSAHVTRAEERLNAIERGLQDRRHDRWHQHMRYKERESADSFFCCRPHGHRVRGRRRFETDTEEHDFLARVGFGNFQAVEWR